MADGKFFAAELDREADKHMGQVVRLRELAEQVRTMPVANLPTAELRVLLARLGFCVLPAEALSYAEVALSVFEPPDDALGMHGSGPSEYVRSLDAVREALTFTTHGQLPRHQVGGA
jgi:hypothetical protein